MEGKKQLGTSSFTSDLFGSKESTSSGGLFGSIFAPQPKVLGRESLRSETSVEKKQHSFKPESNSETVPSGNRSQNREEEKQSTTSREMTSNYPEQRMQPCHLSSSIYYGGQDVYAYPQNSQSYSYSAYNKGEGEDDSGSASRGNWWQGSLYY